MGTVFVDVGVSLDGYLAGPNGGPENPMGGQGENLHEWMFRTESFLQHIGMSGGEQSLDNDLIKAVFERPGAYIMGRRMFDEGEVCWPDEAPFHAPVFVLTHSARAPWVRPGGTTFYFVTEGLDQAMLQAEKAANGKDIRISGGADTVRQYLSAGRVQEMTLHVAPKLLRTGLRLFGDDFEFKQTLEPIRTIHSPYVSHLTYRVV